MYLKAFIICVEIYELDPVHFLSAPGLAWQAALKNTKVKLDLLTDMDILLMVKKVEDVTLSINMWNLIINAWKVIIKIKNHPILNIGT